VAEFQRNIIKQEKRNMISRHFHAKSDKERIAAWKLDLVGILNIFNVRSIVPAWLLLTLHSQTEFAINTHVVVSDTHALASDTHILVSDIHRNMAKGQEGSDGVDLSVSEIRTLSITE
jgi:hypothetical protein